MCRSIVTNYFCCSKSITAPTNRIMTRATELPLQIYFVPRRSPFIDIVIVYNQDDFVAGWLDNRDGFRLRDFFTLSPYAASIQTLRIALAPYSNARLS